MTANRKTLGAGLTFLAVAFIYGTTAIRDLPMGTFAEMGPGLFPAILCIILAALGGILVIISLFEAPEIAFDVVAWRALFVVSAGILFFGTFIREAGMALAVFVTAFVCALAAKETRPLLAVAIGVVMSVFCVAVFIYGIGLPVPVVGSWFGG